MASYNKPTRAAAWRIMAALADFSNPGALKAAPTLAAGDWKVSIDGGAFANLATLPQVLPAAGTAVQIDLSSGEMTGDTIVVTGIDQTSPKEWGDFFLCILTV